MSTASFSQSFLGFIQGDNISNELKKKPGKFKQLKRLANSVLEEGTKTLIRGLSPRLSVKSNAEYKSSSLVVTPTRDRSIPEIPGKILFCRNPNLVTKRREKNRVAVFWETLFFVFPSGSRVSVLVFGQRERNHRCVFSNTCLEYDPKQLRFFQHHANLTDENSIKYPRLGMIQEIVSRGQHALETSRNAYSTYTFKGWKVCTKTMIFEQYNIYISTIYARVRISSIFTLPIFYFHIFGQTLLQPLVVKQGCPGAGISAVYFE